MAAYEEGSRLPLVQPQQTPTVPIISIWRGVETAGKAMAVDPTQRYVAGALVGQHSGQVGLISAAAKSVVLLVLVLVLYRGGVQSTVPLSQE